MALTVIKDFTHSDTLNLKVRGILSEIAMYCEDIEGARNFFRTRIKELSTGNHQKAEYTFRILEVNNRFFEIWHHRPDGAADYWSGSVGE